MSQYGPPNPGQAQPAPGYAQPAPHVPDYSQVPPGYTQAPQGYAQAPQGYAQAPQGYAQPAPVAPARPNPLAGTPVSDWVRDGAAAVLLLISLALPWTVDLDSYTTGPVVGAGRIEVLLVTILSVLSLAITYLARFRALGASTTLGRVVLFRVLLNVPYALVVLTWIVLDGIGQPFVGLGAAATVGFAGALLAASPRAFETRGLQPRAPIARGAFVITVSLVGLAALVFLVGIILASVTIFTGSYGVSEPLQAVGAIVMMLVGAATVLVPGIFLLRRSQVTATIVGALGIAVVAATVLNALTGFVLAPGVESLRNGGYTGFWLAAIGIAATSPAFTAGLTPMAELARWFIAAKQTLLTIAIAAGAFTLITVVTVIFPGSQPVGLHIGVLLILVLSGVAALIARVQLVTSPATTRVVVLSISAAIALLGIIATVLGGVAVGQSYLGVAGTPMVVPPLWILVTLTGLATLVALSLTVPAPVRQYYAAHAPKPVAPAAAYPGTYAPAQPAYPAQPQAAPAQPAYPAQPETAPAQAPAQPQAAPAHAPVQAPAPAPLTPAPLPSAPAVDPVFAAAASRASDPTTPAVELHALTGQRELWPHLAANPALYPELREWLITTGDPAVLAVFGGARP